MKTLEDLSTDSRKKLATTLFILGGIIAIAVVVLVTLKQDAGVLDGSLILTGTMLILLGNIIRRNKQQCSEEDAGTNMSPVSRKKQTIGTAILVIASILMVASAVLIISQSSGETGAYLGIIGGAMMVIGGVRMRRKAYASKQSNEDAGT